MIEAFCLGKNLAKRKEKHLQTWIARGDPLLYTTPLPPPTHTHKRFRVNHLIMKTTSELLGAPTQANSVFRFSASHSGI